MPLLKVLNFSILFKIETSDHQIIFWRPACKILRYVSTRLNGIISTSRFPTTRGFSPISWRTCKMIVTQKRAWKIKLFAIYFKEIQFHIRNLDTIFGTTNFENSDCIFWPIFIICQNSTSHPEKNVTFIKLGAPSYRPHL